MQTMIGVIGGSGVYQIDGLEGATWLPVKTPWGKPSDEVLVGRLDGVPMAFLPRHGRGHVHSPSSVPYRANIAALKSLGCTDLVAVSAVGSLRADYAPGDFVIVDQFIDRTFAREKSFFGPGCVAHVSVAHPTCPRLGAAAAEAARAAGVKVHEGAVYLAMEGPQFSTLAESRLYRSWGADVIGMTGMPEAKLAREAELCYASVAMVTDYDCWHRAKTPVTVDMIVGHLQANITLAHAILVRLPDVLARRRFDCTCGHALDNAILTAPAAIPAALRRILAPILGARGAA